MLDLLIELVVLSGGTRFGLGCFRGLCRVGSVFPWTLLSGGTRFGWGCFRGLCRVGSVFPWTLLNRFRAFCLSGGDPDSDSEELILIPVEELRTKEMRKLKKWEN